MERAAIRNLHVLIAGGKGNSVQLLRMALNIAGISDITVIPEAARALELLRQEYFDVIYCDETADKIGGMGFPQAARKSEGVLNAMLPIFVFYSRVYRREVEIARDEGVTDVLTAPISAATILRKLDAAIIRPRPFIVAPDFFGPDRRTDARKNFGGNDRRVRNPRKVKVGANGKVKNNGSNKTEDLNV